VVKRTSGKTGHPEKTQGVTTVGVPKWECGGTEARFKNMRQTKEFKSDVFADVNK
jgi:hypothetical protein